MTNGVVSNTPTLQDIVRLPWIFACKKHDLALGGESPEAYADNEINKLTPAELLEAISTALLDMKIP